jgi:hypothetical protein
MRLGVLACAGVLTACGSGDDVYYVPVGGTAPAQARTVPVDTDATLEPTEQGKEVGLFVEYATGGDWHIFTSCDTLVQCPPGSSSRCNALACNWDVVATAITGKLSATSAEIDPDDEVDRIDDGSVRLMLTTFSEKDSVHLSADPGEKLELDLFLDGNYDPSYVFWVTGGAATTGGAPSDPVVFSPTAP